jgi:phage tail tube protein FII
MKNLTLDNKSIKLVRTVLTNEIYLLEFNIRNEYYDLQEKEEVIQEIDTLNNVINQLGQE